MWKKTWLDCFLSWIYIISSVLAFLSHSLSLSICLKSSFTFFSIVNSFHLCSFTHRPHLPFFLLTLHTPLSLFLLILCLVNVPPPLQYTLKHLSTHPDRHTHTLTLTHTNTHRPFSSASLSECDWLITTQKAWLCWCQKQDRYPRPQGAQRRLMSLSFNPTAPLPFLAFSLHCHLYRHSHFPTRTVIDPCWSL